MFKEKYLIFKEGEPSPQSAEQPETLSKKPEERKAHSQDTAEDLLSEKSVEEKTEEVMEELYKLFTRGKIPFSEEFFKANRDANFILEAFLGDKVKAYVTKKLNDGFEFGGYGHGGITFSWWTPEPEKEMVTEINPSFLDKKVSDVLNEETKKLIAKTKWEILEKKFQRDIKPIYEGLVQQKLLTEAFTLERFIKSDFARDIKDIMRVNYDAKSLVYTWEITAEGVQFIPSEKMKEKGFEPIELKIEDYDSNLNYKNPPPAPFKNAEGHPDFGEKTAVGEFALKEPVNLGEISPAQYYDEEMQSHEDDLDMMVLNNEDLGKLHFEQVKPLMSDIKDMIEEAVEIGIPKSQIKTKIKNLVRESGLEDELERLRDGASEADYELNSKYGDALEKWIDALYQKYDPSVVEHSEHKDYEE